MLKSHKAFFLKLKFKISLNFNDFYILFPNLIIFMPSMLQEQTVSASFCSFKVVKNNHSRLEILIIIIIIY